MGKIELLDQSPSEEEYHFGVAWWGFVYLSTCGATLILVLVSILATFATLFPATQWPALIWIPILLLGIIIVLTTAQVVCSYSTFTLTPSGMWVKWLFRRKFIQWHLIEHLYYRPLLSHGVRVRNERPVPFLLGGFFLEPVNLMFGLSDREELFWEIYTRASEVHGYKIPVKDWLGSPVTKNKGG